MKRQVRGHTRVVGRVGVGLALLVAGAALDLRGGDVALVTGLVDGGSSDVGLSRHFGGWCVWLVIGDGRFVWE